MNIQIYGTKKCSDTRKAERYFKERSLKYQYIDILKYGLSKGELANVRAAVGLERLINAYVKEYTVLNLDKIRATSLREEILQNNPKLYRTPIVRNGRLATVGYEPEVWGAWSDA